MGVEILERIIEAIINNFINESIDLISTFVSAGNVFNCENVVKDLFGVEIEPVTATVFGIAYWFLILKFVWKGFDIYILGGTGDEDADPMVLFINFIKALAISLGFGVIFNSFMNIASQTLNDILYAFNFNNLHLDMGVLLGELILSPVLGLGILILILVYIILIVYLNIKFMVYVMQMLILRIGICFATSGLLDSDQGVFKPYIKKFFQLAFSVIIQTVCFKLSLLGLANQNVLAAIIAASMAITAPQFLSEFIMTTQSSGKLQQAIYSISILRSFAR
ncbi:MAG: conjugal transfer protein TrbL family protein [Lachnospiraceae bacterium]